MPLDRSPDAATPRKQIYQAGRAVGERELVRLHFVDSEPDLAERSFGDGAATAIVCISQTFDYSTVEDPAVRSLPMTSLPSRIDR